MSHRKTGWVLKVSPEGPSSNLIETFEDKVITTMVIGPLDDHTYCALCFTHWGLW